MLSITRLINSNERRIQNVVVLRDVYNIQAIHVVVLCTHFYICYLSFWCFSMQLIHLIQRAKDVQFIFVIPKSSLATWAQI